MGKLATRHAMNQMLKKGLIATPPDPHTVPGRIAAIVAVLTEREEMGGRITYDLIRDTINACADYCCIDRGALRVAIEEYWTDCRGTARSAEAVIREICRFEN